MNEWSSLGEIRDQNAYPHSERLSNYQLKETAAEKVKN